MRRLFFLFGLIAASLAVSPADGQTEPNWVPVYRLVKVASGHQEHFYTASLAEKDYAVSRGYSYERVAFHVSSSAFSGGSEVFRLRKDEAGYVVRLYTVSAFERDQAVKTGYVVEKRLGYLSPGYQSGLSLVYRSYKATIGDRFYTTDQAEHQATLNDGYVGESQLGYASATGQAISAPVEPTQPAEPDNPTTGDPDPGQPEPEPAPTPVQPADQVPAVSVDSILPASPLVGDEVIGQGRATNNPVEYQWGCATHSHVLSAADSFRKSDFSAGRHNLFFRARNSAGWSNIVWREITVSQPAPPPAEEPVAADPLPEDPSVAEPPAEPIIRAPDLITEKILENGYVVRTVDIANDGSADLVISNIRLVAYGNIFWLGNLSQTPLVVPPRSSLAVQFSLNAVNLIPGDYWGAFGFESNDKKRPSFQTHVRLTVGAVSYLAKLISPPHFIYRAPPNPILDWHGYTSLEEYQLEVAADYEFTDLVYSQRVKASYHQLVNLTPDRIYYWRVRIINPWSQGPANPWSEIHWFNTWDYPDDPDWDGLKTDWELQYGFDPYRPDLLIELDCFQGYQPSAAVLSEIFQAFQAAGIRVTFLPDQTDLSPDLLPVPPTMADYHRLLNQTRHPSLSPAIHVIFAKYGEINTLGEVIMEEETDSKPLENTGGLIFVQSTIDYRRKRISQQPGFGRFSEDDLIAKVAIHEIGHMLGAPHEGTSAKYRQINPYNVMIPGFAEESMTGLGNSDPELGATGDGPRFSLEALAQFNLTEKLSANSRWLDLGDFTDTGGPIFIFHGPVGDQLGLGPVAINAVIFDDSAGLTRVELFYRFNQSAWQSVEMDRVNPLNLYQTEIPVQAEAGVIDYYLVAINDLQDIQIEPDQEPEYYSFSLGIDGSAPEEPAASEEPEMTEPEAAGEPEVAENSEETDQPDPWASYSEEQQRALEEAVKAWEEALKNYKGIPPGGGGGGCAIGRETSAAGNLSALLICLMLISFVLCLKRRQTA